MGSSGGDLNFWGDSGLPCFSDNVLSGKLRPSMHSSLVLHTTHSQLDLDITFLVLSLACHHCLL